MITYASDMKAARTYSRPYCWVREDHCRRLTRRQALAVAASDHCTESAYIHPVGDPETKLTTRADIEAHDRAIAGEQ
jgi:hypothetical protein